MPLNIDKSPTSFRRWGWLAIACVLSLAFVTGGGSTDRGLGDVAAQLLALPLLMWSVLALHRSGCSRLQCAALGVAALIVLTVALQLLPLTETWSGGTAARLALRADLQAAGVTKPLHQWSLSPSATELGLWSMLPALAVFVGTLAMPTERQPHLLLLLVALTALSLVLGYVQLGAPQDSFINPFPQWAPALNGVFANPNHQGTAAGICIVSIAGVLLSGRSKEVPLYSRSTRFALGGLAVFLFASLVLIDGRAMFLLTVLGLVAVPLVLRRYGGGGRYATRARVLLTVLGAVASGVIVSAVRWLRFDDDWPVRGSVAEATFAMGAAHAPWGAGVGSFVAWFDQSAPSPLVEWEYINHAHNEYAQWWLESGLLGVLAVLAVVALLASCYPRDRRGAGDLGLAVGAWMGCALLLLHSLVDYPLRTPALMTVAALLAGMAVGQRAHQGASLSTRDKPQVRSPESSVS